MQSEGRHLLTIVSTKKKKCTLTFFAGILQVRAGKLRWKKRGSDSGLQPLISLEKVCARLGGPEWPFADKTAAEETGTVDKWDIRIQRRSRVREWEREVGVEYGQQRADISPCRRWDVSAVHKDPHFGKVFKFQPSAAILWHGGLEKLWTHLEKKLMKKCDLTVFRNSISSKSCWTGRNVQVYESHQESNRKPDTNQPTQFKNVI